jgi:hypothetical protein
VQKRRKVGSGTQVHSKGYLRVCKGPCKNQYVHRIVAAAWLGRELKRDEQVHHRGDKLDPRHWHLLIIGECDHGWVSAKQAYFMQHIKEAADKQEWDEFMEEQSQIQAAQIADSKRGGKPVIIRDGALQEAWEADH